MQARKWELHLPLDSKRSKNPEPLRLSAGIVQQGRLAYSRLASHNQCCAAASAGFRKQMIDDRALRLPVGKSSRAPSGGRFHSAPRITADSTVTSDGGRSSTPTRDGRRSRE